jgi:hypothetical protein
VGLVLSAAGSGVLEVEVLDVVVELAAAAVVAAAVAPAPGA